MEQIAVCDVSAMSTDDFVFLYFDNIIAPPEANDKIRYEVVTQLPQVTSQWPNDSEILWDDAAVSAM